MKVAVLFSGGKDSCFSIYQAQKQEHEIACLVSILPENKESYMFHYPNIKLTELQAKAMGFIYVSMISPGKKEEELNELYNILSIVKNKYKVEGIVSGAIQSTYQKNRVDDVCRKLDLKSIAPLWNINHEDYMQELILRKFKAIIVGIAADGLNESWLGKEINRNTLTELRNLNLGTKMHLAGEGGEYESLVLDAPMFKKQIIIKSSKTNMENSCTGALEITKVELRDK
ncbi:diphthine--ammonia ligase [Candidatus Woesearchaeota archaeon]|nr:diphthine--ammonia ligase [Candidatus Woesearchaeota archaeon]